MSASTTQSTTTSSTLARKGPEKSTTQYVWDGWQSDDDIGSLYSKGQARDHNIPHAPPCGARYEHLTIERDAPRESDDKVQHHRSLIDVEVYKLYRSLM